MVFPPHLSGLDTASNALRGQERSPGAGWSAAMGGMTCGARNAGVCAAFLADVSVSGQKVGSLDSLSGLPMRKLMMDLLGLAHGSAHIPLNLDLAIVAARPRMIGAHA